MTLNGTCKQQQVGEGRLATNADIHLQAISMTVHQIMQCRHIVSCVPYPIKVKAIKATPGNQLTNTVPATMLKKHLDFVLFPDKDSASGIDPATVGFIIL